MRIALLLPLSLLLATPASAAKLGKMTDAELAKFVADPGADEGDRVEAAELLVDHRAHDQVATMVGACQPTDIPNVCEHVLAAFEDMQDEAAMAQVEVVLMNDGLDDGLQHKALKILTKLAPYRVDARVPELLRDYRKLGAGFAVDLVATLPARDLDDWQDITILIATDQGAKRRVRLAALEAAEAFDHPALSDAWLGLLDDENKKVRTRCAKNLGRSDLPSSEVRPALVEVVRSDKAGTVRAAALHSLRFHADPELLPLLHDEALNELHPVAWGRAMELLEPLADASSVSTLCQLLGRQENLLEQGVIRIVHTLVRIGDPAAVPCLETLERATTSGVVRTEARAAIDLLAVPEVQRIEVLSGWSVVEVVLADPAAPEPEPFQLGVTLDANGMAVWATVPTE